MIFRINLILLLFSTALDGQGIPAGGRGLVADLQPGRMSLSQPGLGKVKAFSNQEGELVMRMVTKERPPHIYSLSRSIPLEPVAIPKGRAVLISFQARTVEASLETREAKLQLLLRQNDRHQDNLKRTVSIANNWKTYYFPLETTVDVAPGDLDLNIQFGYPPQVVVIRDVQLTLYPSGVVPSDLPRTRITYAGRDKAAEWRKDAARRIERHRKGSFSIQFVDGSGEPLQGMPVSIEQEQHSFRWGAAVNAQALAREPERYDRITSAFNTVVFENDLKIKRWSKPDFKANTLAAMAEFERRGIAVKGHTLIWPGFQYLPPVIRTSANNPDRVRKIMDDHVADILDATAGKVTHWDVVNEAYSNRDLQEITGSEEILYDGFRKVAAADPSAGRYVNEFGIINRGGHNETKQQWYYDYIQRVDEATGGLVQGIGIQCHMGADLTPPERVLEILDFYADLGKELSVSEFTIDLDDPELRFDYTRDFLTAAFSHPSVAEFLFWGYYGDTHPKASIYTADWAPGDMGAAFFALTQDLWHTSIEAATDGGGRIQGRGFYGRYRYSYEENGERKTGTFSLKPGEAAVLTIGR